MFCMPFLLQTRCKYNTFFKACQVMEGDIDNTYYFLTCERGHGKGDHKLGCGINDR